MKKLTLMGMLLIGMFLLVASAPFGYGQIEEWVARYDGPGYSRDYASAQDKPATADNIMKEALQRASKENKNVFLMFHASWCGWCKKMDAALMDEVCKDSFDKNYVIIHMVVKESQNKKHLENPGAAEFLAKYNGDKSGIPFWLIFDKKGKLLADSFMRPEGVGLDQPGSNIGCPGLDNEVAAFIDILKASSSMTEKELAIISERFKKNRN